MLIGGIATPQGLDQRCCGLPSSYHVLLPLLLLHFECETASENSLDLEEER